MDFWSRGLRSGDNGATPRRGQWSKPSTTPNPPQPDKTKPEKLTGSSTPSLPPTTRIQAPISVRKPTPLIADCSESQQKLDSPSKPASVYSGDGDADGTEDFENESVRVFVRVRPPTQQELAHDKHEACLTVIGSRTLQLSFREKQNTVHRFMFDQVLPEDTPQQDVFDVAGLVAVDNCLAGYNSSIFAYGQTGAGKTFTVIGQINSPEQRGLAPRVFEYLFAKITDHENARGPDTVKYNCRCSFLEIYNETIADLLNPNANNLPIREDPEKGPYVDGLSEPPALNVDEMLQHLLRGADNRHTGETRLNRESSRSHSVFMCTVEKTVTSNGISKCYYAKLNLVDLAGSERIASGAHGGSNATGEHFKEACHINKSLTALGRVTTELVKSQKNGGGGHVPYRDSKLTFLLQSSLGGNAKTLIIANVSPSSVCATETLSTLRFAKQTKHIRNDAKVNWTVQGDRLAMQREIERLRMELAGMRSGITEPLVQANEELTARLEEERQRREEVQQERERAISALNQARRENRLLDQRLVGLAAISGMDGSRGAGALATVVEQLETMDAGTFQRRFDIAELEQELLTLQLRIAQDTEARLTHQLLALGMAGEKMEQELRTSESRVAEAEEHLQISRNENSLLTAKVDCAVSDAAELQRLLDDKQAVLDEQTSCMEVVRRQLEGALAEVQHLQFRLAEAQEEVAQASVESSAMRIELTDRMSHLTCQLEAAEARSNTQAIALEEAQRDLNVSREELVVRDARQAELDVQLKSKTAACSSALQHIAAMESELAAQSEARLAAENSAVALSARLASLQEQLAASESTSEALRHDLEALSTKQAADAQAEARALSALSEQTAVSQRQIADMEERHLREVQALKDELDKRSGELKARDQEILRTNFVLKGQIDRLQAAQTRETAAAKANLEQVKASHHAAISGLNERLTKQSERYAELSKRHDALKAQYDQALREVEAWKTKSERYDQAMADVYRLIGFVRNPPGSARSSLIITRSDQLSPNIESSRWAGVASRISESPAQSPRMSQSLYNSSPVGSKPGSIGTSTSHRMKGIHEDEEVESVRRVPDITSPGDQLPIPELD